MEHPVARSLLLLVAALLGCVAAQQGAAPSPADAAPTAGQQGAGGSYFRSQNQKNDKKTTVADSATTVAPPASGVVLYKQEATDHSICTLVRTDGLITFYFRDKIKEDVEKDIYMEDDITSTGFCNQPSKSLLTMRWRTFTLNWFFAKTPGGERWYMDKMELKFNTSEKKLDGYPKPAQAVKLTTTEETKLFPTPAGKSFRCMEDIEIKLVGHKDISAMITLRDTKIQPFIYRNDDFGPEFMCSVGSESGYRDEKAPLAVGTTLAVVTLLTVAGYGVYRYVKIKKVQYDNVE